MRYFFWSLAGRSPAEALLAVGILAILAWGIYWIRHAD